MAVIARVQFDPFQTPTVLIVPVVLERLDEYMASPTHPAHLPTTESITCPLILSLHTISG